MKKIICKQCNMDFFDFPSNDRKFCSKACKNQSQIGKPALNKGRKGKKAWNKGISYHALEKHNLWKGDKVGYCALHRWVRKQLGIPTFCNNNLNHISKRFVWANISGEYKRDLNDWHSLCNSCNLTDGISTKYKFINRQVRRQESYA